MKAKINIKELLDTLTIEEKIGQCMQLIPTFFFEDKKGEISGPMNELHINEDDIFRSGSVLGLDNAKDMIDIQTRYLSKSTHKIPLIFMADVIHGFRTVFPVPLAMGCTWDLSSAKKSAQIAAKEAALSGIQVTFSPMADLVRDPRWGRVMESTGEDTYLNSLFAKAFVKGYQGDMTEEYNIAACIKHFAAYGAPEGGREYNTVDMSDRTLREYYLPSYKAAIDEGCELVMTSFNTVHGIPSTGNSYLLRDILRGEWGFDGVVISDWGSLGELIAHGVASDGKEAAKKSLEAGLDMEMMTSHYVNNLKELIEEGVVKESLLDEAVIRILKLKEKMGLFENPYKAADPELAEASYLSKEHRKEARKIASKSMVLLKNEGILPFSKEQKVAVIGPFADNNEILGPWAVQGKNEEADPLILGIKNKIGDKLVITAKGCDISGEDTSLIEEAVNIAKEADVIILALGEDQSMSGEGGSRSFITLPGVQEQLLQSILSLGKKTAVVLFNGRPLEITQLSQSADAILEAWYPGSEGGNAVADVLFGDVNPSGRLTMSFPYTVGQIPVYYNCYNTGRPKDDSGVRYVSQYLDIPNEPLYPFGYGLSYTTFEYGRLTLDQDTMKAGGSIKASITIKNTGNVTGIETVQLYIRDLVGNTVRPLKELKDFSQIELNANEEKTVHFTITDDMLKYHNFRSEYLAEAGEFQVMVGHDSCNLSTSKFTYIN